MGSNGSIVTDDPSLAAFPVELSGIFTIGVAGPAPASVTVPVVFVDAIEVLSTGVVVGVVFC